MNIKSNLRNAAIRVAMALTVMPGLVGCGSGPEEATRAEPTTFITTPPEAGTIAGPGVEVAVTGPVAVVAVDTSRSVDGTDLHAAAQNKLQELVARMPIGGLVVLRAINNNVGAMCEEVRFTLDAQNNDALTDQVRQANQLAVGPKFEDHIACSARSDQGGTELFAGLADVFAMYPTAEIVEIYSDGVDTTVGGMGRAKNLRDPAFPREALNRIPVALTPQLSPQVQIAYHGIGRNTGLPADAIAVLRSIVGAWTQKTQATFYFTAG